MTRGLKAVDVEDFGEILGQAGRYIAEFVLSLR